MIEIIVLLTVGCLIGWLCGRNNDNKRVYQCPRCAVEDRTQDLLWEINSLKRQGQEQMYQAVREGRQP
jgi:hypothetical protein